MNNGFNVKHLECFKKCYINPSHSIITILILHLCVTYQTTVKLFKEIGLEILQHVRCVWILTKCEESILHFYPGFTAVVFY